MSRNPYWLGAAMPLIVALTTIAWAEGPSVVLTEAVQYRGPLVSVDATNVVFGRVAISGPADDGAPPVIDGPSGGRAWSVSTSGPNPPDVCSARA